MPDTDLDALAERIVGYCLNNADNFEPTCIQMQRWVCARLGEAVAAAKERAAKWERLHDAQEVKAAEARAALRNAAPHLIARAREAERLEQEVESLSRLVYEAHHVHYGMGYQYHGLPLGLCDAVDRDGNPYISQHGADLLRAAAKRLGKKLEWPNA